MANIMQQVKLRNSISRDSFDLSFRNAFTAKIGQLLPVCVQEVIPGDTFNLEVQHFTRTQPVNTAAYTRMREYYDWFFVPYNLLWNKFGSFVTQMTDNNQHATGINDRQTLTDMHPYFTLNQVHDFLKSATDSAKKDIMGYSFAESSRRLLEYLNYGNFGGSVVPNQASQFPQLYSKNVNLNPFPLLAYQKIYQDYYRNSQWEQAYAPAFNIDYISGAQGSLNIPVSQISFNAENMFSLRYANWHKDLFMGLLPNAQYGNASVVDSGSATGSFNVSNGPTTAFNALLRISANRTLQEVGLPLSTGVQSSSFSGTNTVNAGSNDSQRIYFSADDVNTLRNCLGLSNSGSLDINTSFTILALRQAEALQRWKEITQSQQQDYKSQVEAHFGVSPNDGYSDRCRWIDGHVSNLDISEVTNTNITDNNAADIAGKGVGVGQGKTTFKSTEHGILMCIYHCVPLLDYSISGVRRFNLKTKATDYAIPEFDRTGMVSVPLVELTNSADTDNFDSDLLGYAPRYYDYKQNIDVVKGGFTGSLAPWVAPFSDAYIKQYLSGSRARPLGYSFFKINPSVMNPVFAMAAASSYASDQLLVNCSFDIKAVRNLDRNGLPY